MSTTITGIVTNGVVVPNALLPEGAHVAIHLSDRSPDTPPVLPGKPPPRRQSMLEFLGTLPPGPLLFKTPQDANRYIQEERDSWERGPAIASAAAPDGTPYLTFEESRRTYWQTDVTRERYEREAKLRWPKCDICGRSIARMREHLAAHQSGTLDERGVNTDPQQRTRSRRRVAKWRASLARKAR